MTRKTLEQHAAHPHRRSRGNTAAFLHVGAEELTEHFCVRAAHFLAFPARKDLTPDEIEAIVTAAKVPNKLHKDIAQEFKVPAILVSKLVKESREIPSKHEAYRTKLQLNERKRQVIEETTTEMLADNKAIVRLQQVQKAVEEKAGFEVDFKQVR